MNQALWAASDRTVLHSYPVALAVEDEQKEAALARLAGALDLIEATRPGWLSRMRSRVARIQVRRIISSAGGWDRVSRQVELDLDYLLRPTVSVSAIASTLIHEFTHARIDAAGIGYGNKTRVRIEQACVSQELAFTKSLSPSEEQIALVANLERLYDNAAETWSLEAEERRYRKATRATGMPDWMVGVMWWILRRRRGR